MALAEGLVRGVGIVVMVADAATHARRCVGEGRGVVVCEKAEVIFLVVGVVVYVIAVAVVVELVNLAVTVGVPANRVELSQVLHLNEVVVIGVVVGG